MTGAAPLRPPELAALAVLLQRRRRRVLPTMRKRRDAAVLVPLVHMPDGLHVLFTLRTDTVPTHKGQVAFPGGGVEEDDPDAVAAALRETDEELGIPSHLVDVLGVGDDAVSITGQRVTPVVGYLSRWPALTPSEREIADVFTVSLAALQRPQSLVEHELSSADGKVHRVPFFEGGKHTIWGLTAWILKELLTVMDGLDRGPSPLEHMHK